MHLADFVWSWGQYGNTKLAFWGVNFPTNWGKICHNLILLGYRLKWTHTHTHLGQCLKESVLFQGCLSIDSDNTLYMFKVYIFKNISGLNFFQYHSWKLLICCHKNLIELNSENFAHFNFKAVKCQETLWKKKLRQNHPQGLHARLFHSDYSAA